MRRYAALLALFLLGFSPLAGGASEKVLLFSARGTLSEEAVLEVREDITVNAEGQQIRRGIYRDFPTRYNDVFGVTTEVGFTVKRVLLDGSPVPWKSVPLAGGVRIYMGDPDNLAPLGRHTYTLIYATTGQVGVFARHDELYWNVTGNGWVFPIEKARFSLSLPGNPPFSSVEFYTGAEGAKGQDARILNSDAVETTKPLPPYEGLTVVYTWPKGLITPPPLPRGVRFMRRYRTHVLVSLPFFFLLVYLLLWRIWGKDPPLGTVVPLFAPPEGESPGFLRYINRMGADDACFAAEVLNLAVQGYIVIEELTPRELLARQGWDGGFLRGILGLSVRLGSSVYILKRTDKKKPSRGRIERLLLSRLFQENTKELLLQQENHEVFSTARKRMEDFYYGKGKRPFTKHTGLWVLGFLIPLPLLLLFVWGRTPDLAALELFLMAFLTLGIFLTGKSVGAFRRRGFFRKFFGGVLPLCCFGALLFLALRLLGPRWAAFPLSALGVALVVVFFRGLMTVRTVEGTAFFAKIKGLEMYMKTAERHRLERMHPPEATPEHFERLLPYAFALDAAETWANRFDDVFKESGYVPSWHSGGHGYSGAGFAALPSRISSSLISASQAPGTSWSSSSSSPGSSSGAGGGGCSGGGGGGGGGGGW